jgi:acetyl-CoA acetyltransferase
LTEVYIIDAVRTPIGIGKPESGVLFPIAPMDLAALVLGELLRRAELDPELVEDVILG